MVESLKDLKYQLEQINSSEWQARNTQDWHYLKTLVSYVFGEDTEVKRIQAMGVRDFQLGVRINGVDTFIGASLVEAIRNVLVMSIEKLDKEISEGFNE